MCIRDRPILLNEMFQLQGARYYGYLMSANGITVILLTPLISAVTSRWRSISNLGLAGLFFACGFGVIFFCSNLPLFFISTIIWTIGEILHAINLNVFLAENAPASHRGRFHALYNSIAGAGHSLGPWLCGLFLMRFAILWVWPISFALALSGAAILYTLYPVSYTHLDVYKRQGPSYLRNHAAVSGVPGESSVQINQV